jgi:tripartite-type tricarboxylate transporter receptor subunit TctC
VAINQHWIRGLGYDPINDLQPVALATVVPLALVIPAAAPYATVTDMLKASKARGLRSRPPAPGRRGISPASCSSSRPAAT